MSLINQMLQDLEKRQGEPGSSGQLPLGVQPAPLANSSGRMRKWLLPVLLLVVAGGAATVYLADDFGFELFPVATPPAAVAPAPPPAVVEPPQAPVEPAVPLEPPPPAMEPIPALQPAAVLLPAPPANAAVEAVKPPVAEKEKPAPVAVVQERQNIPKAAAPAPLKTTAGGETAERAEALYREALAAFGQGRTAESQAQARKALEILPAHVGARQLLVRQLLEQRASDLARAELKEGLLQQPGQTLWSTWLVRLELERGDLLAARQAVDQGLSYAANQADFQSLAGAVAQRQGKGDEAAEFYRAALHLKPADGRAWVGLGLALESEGHAPEAKEAFRRALSIEGLAPELLALAQRKTR